MQRSSQKNKEILGSEPAKIITIRPDHEVSTKQGIPYLLGVTGTSSGARGLSMSMVIIPPGGAAIPHYHKGFETAVYIIEGEVETRFGENLAESVINRAGDFLYIPENLPHQPVNRSKTKPVKAIVARTDPNEQESVMEYVYSS